MAKPPKKCPLSSGNGGILPEPLLHDLRRLIEQGRERVAQAINRELVMLHWFVGDSFGELRQRIHREILGEERADYGKQVVQALSTVLSAEYGRGFSRQSLFHMIRCAEVFPEEESVSTVPRHFLWSHLLEVIYLKLKDNR